MRNCIFCKVEPINSKISQEHIIPSVLGGWISLPITCKEHADDYTIIQEDASIEVLKKQIGRYEKRTGKKVDFDLDSFYSLPNDKIIPIINTDISFIKTSQKGTTIISGLSQPIPFRGIAKIALCHLSALLFPYVMRDIFNPIKNWILNDGTNHFVLIHTILHDIYPNDLEYLQINLIRKLATLTLCF